MERTREKVTRVCRNELPQVKISIFLLTLQVRNSIHSLTATFMLQRSMFASKRENRNYGNEEGSKEAGEEGSEEGREKEVSHSRQHNGGMR